MVGISVLYPRNGGIILNKCNFGGFVGLSTVDLPGRAACAVFLRGCPNQCPWCHNPKLISGENFVPIEYLKELISSSRIAASSVVFSGGEPTHQPDSLRELLSYSKKLGFYTALHTSGVYPQVLESLVAERLVDRVALDIKAPWDRYPEILGNSHTQDVRSSLLFCRSALHNGQIDHFEVVHTVFPSTVAFVSEVARYAPENTLILQQGNDMGGASTSPFTLKALAASCGSFRGTIYIRTREFGEQLVIGSPVSFTKN